MVGVCLFSLISIGSSLPSHLCHSVALADELTPGGESAYEKITGGDADEGRRRWDALFDRRTYVYGKEPAAFLRDHIQLLPVGRALDIAMGEGRNAVFLAKKGFQVEGVDISEVAIRKAKFLAKENRVSIKTIRADLTTYSISSGNYDAIININYLQRSLIPEIKKGLRKGGIVVYENPTVAQIDNPGGLHLPRDTLLEKGELKRLFKEFEILLYREVNDGKDARASLIARKR
jgi:tellurite methyltransferase